MVDLADQTQIVTAGPFGPVTLARYRMNSGGKCSSLICA